MTRDLRVVTIKPMKIWVDRSEVQVGDIIYGSHGPGEHLPKGDMHRVVTSKATLDVIIPDPSQTRIFVERSPTPGAVRPPPQKVVLAGSVRSEGTGPITFTNPIADPPTPKRNITTADGLTGKQCLDRYHDNMREAVNPDGSPRRWKLTSAQKTLAQLMWGVELKRKAAAQKELDASRAISVVTQEDDE